MNIVYGLLLSIGFFILGTISAKALNGPDENKLQRTSMKGLEDQSLTSLNASISELHKNNSKQSERIAELENKISMLQILLSEDEKVEKPLIQSESLQKAVVSNKGEGKTEGVTESKLSKSKTSNSLDKQASNKKGRYDGLSKEAFVNALKQLPKKKQLEEAIMSDRSDAIDFLVENDVDLNNEVVDELPLIVFAASKGKSDSIKSMLKYGVTVDRMDDDGYTALHWAKDLDVAKTLIEGGADPNFRSLENDTPLHWAQHGDIAKLLIERGASVDVTNQSGRSPLFTLNSRSAIKAVLDAGLDPNIEDYRGRTALDFTSEKEDYEKLTMMKQYGAKPGSKVYVDQKIGVGVRIDYDERNPEIKYVHEDGPAAQAGIEKGDVIMEVAQGYSGERVFDTTEKKRTTIKTMIRGRVGSIVQFKVLKKDGSVKTIWVKRNVYGNAERKKA